MPCTKAGIRPDRTWRVTGFEVSEIDVVLEEARGAASKEDEVPEPAFDQEPVTKPGDLWLLGKHRIVCGNSLHQATYQVLLGSRRAAMVFTDPPFNVRIDGHATGNGAIRHREFAMASGEMSEGTCNESYRTKPYSAACGSRRANILPKPQINYHCLQDVDFLSAALRQSG